MLAKLYDQRALRAQGNSYAIIGGVGPKEFYVKTVGTVKTQGSTPGIYRGVLRKEQD